MVVRRDIKWIFRDIGEISDILLRGKKGCLSNVVYQWVSEERDLWSGTREHRNGGSPSALGLG